MRDPQRLRAIDQAFCLAVPYNAWLGLRAEEAGAPGEGRVALRLPYRAELVGDPETGTLHGGPISAAMDAACGASVFLALREPLRIATLDLRIDHVGPPIPGQDLVLRAECVRVTRHVAFTRASADHGDPSAPVTLGSGTFMIFRDQTASMAKLAAAGSSGDPR